MLTPSTILLVKYPCLVGHTTIQPNLPVESPLFSHPASPPAVFDKPVTECQLRQARADGCFVWQNKRKI